MVAECRRRPLTDPTEFEGLLRELAPQVLGVLVRRYGDFDTAEDAVQEALLAAFTRWPHDGVPDNARAWLIQTATRRLIDQWRSDESRRRREALASRQETADAEVPDHDDTLALMFMCCHPALNPSAAIPLTLRVVGGLTTAEIARAFLVDDKTMGQRISRAKKRIRASDVPFGMPSLDEQAPRLRMVLHTLYLIFNEGYASTSGHAVHRGELASEAIRLCRMVHRLLPHDGEVAGLLALMLLLDARRPARSADGELVPLPEQDRSLWDRAMIAEGLELVDDAVARGRVGEYQLQALIAAVHDRAPRPDETDWRQILTLYGLLEQMTGNPVIAVNRAVAAAMAEGPAAGLAILDKAANELAENFRVTAVRAHLLEMNGETDAAVEHYRAAAARATSLPEQRYLARQAARLKAQPSIAAE